jgi:hypothetical protein
MADALVALRYRHFKVKVTETSKVKFSHLKSFCTPLRVSGICGGRCGTEGVVSTSTYVSSSLSAMRPMFRTYLINITILTIDTVIILKTGPLPFCCYFSFSDQDIDINYKLFGVILPYKTADFASYKLRFFVHPIILCCSNIILFFTERSVRPFLVINFFFIYWNFCFISKRFFNVLQTIEM